MPGRKIASQQLSCAIARIQRLLLALLGFRPVLVARFSVDRSYRNMQVAQLGLQRLRFAVKEECAAKLAANHALIRHQGQPVSRFRRGLLHGLKSLLRERGVTTIQPVPGPPIRRIHL